MSLSRSSIMIVKLLRSFVYYVKIVLLRDFTTVSVQHALSMGDNIATQVVYAK